LAWSIGVYNILYALQRQQQRPITKYHTQQMWNFCKIRKGPHQSHSRKCKFFPPPGQKIRLDFKIEYRKFRGRWHKLCNFNTRNCGRWSVTVRPRLSKNDDDNAAVAMHPTPTTLCVVQVAWSRTSCRQLHFHAFRRTKMNRYHEVSHELN
jgi:hypothetical protein